MMGRFVGVCKRRNLKVNSDENKVMAFGEDERLVCEVNVHGSQWS